MWGISAFGSGAWFRLHGSGLKNKISSGSLYQKNDSWHKHRTLKHIFHTEHRTGRLIETTVGASSETEFPQTLNPKQPPKPALVASRDVSSSVAADSSHSAASLSNQPFVKARTVTPAAQLCLVPNQDPKP